MSSLAKNNNSIVFGKAEIVPSDGEKPKMLSLNELEEKNGLKKG